MDEESGWPTVVSRESGSYGRRECVRYIVCEGVVCVVDGFVEGLDGSCVGYCVA